MENNEIKLIQDLLSSTIHVNAAILDQNMGSILKYFRQIYADAFIANVPSGSPLGRLFDAMSPGVIYGISDPFHLYYTALLLPEEEHRLLLLGPCLLEEPTLAFVARMLEKNKLDPGRAESARQFFLLWPVLSQSQLHTVARIVGSYLYGGATLDQRYFQAWENQPSPLEFTDNTDLLLKMRALEEWYAQENALAEAVSKGDRQRAFDIFAGLSLAVKRRQYTPDPLRNAKNNCLAFDERLMRAAERSGVHPVHLESASHLFRCQIELAEDQKSLRTIAQSILRTYILLVQQAVEPTCTGKVRDAVNLIHMDISAPLSVKELAAMLDIHPDYLSRTFKQQMGVSLTEYINRNRIIRSTYLLNETSSSIRDIALSVGYEDINYFSRMFRRYTNVSPTQYRKIACGQSRDEVDLKPKIGQRLK